MKSTFFKANNYFIDQKVNYFNMANAYKVFNEGQENIGSINQKLTTGQKALRLLLNKKMLPFRLEIQDQQNAVLSSINRGWTFFMSKITIHDSNDLPIGYIKQKFAFFTPTFNIFDTSDNLIAVITGNWKAWEFTIKDANGMQIGTISKKWAGLLKEAFTSADKYIVNIDPTFSNEAMKVLIVSSAITIDMVLKENK